MKKDNFKTDVMFRKEKDNSITAFFPHFPYDYNYDGKGLITCYAHIGQHSGADYNHCISVSKPAKENEYKDLFEELESIGYDLNIVKRQNYDKYLRSYKEINKIK